MPGAISSARQRCQDRILVLIEQHPRLRRVVVARFEEAPSLSLVKASEHLTQNSPREYAGRPLPYEPMRHAKYLIRENRVEVLAKRHAEGFALWHPADLTASSQAGDAAGVLVRHTLNWRIVGSGIRQLNGQEAPEPDRDLNDAMPELPYIKRSQGESVRKVEGEG